MNAKKIEMNAKKEAIENIYKLFSENVYSKSRKDLLKKLFEAGKGRINANTVYVDEQDFEYAKELFTSLNVEKSDIKGGMIIENKDGTERIDFTLNILMENLRKKTLSEVSKFLFGE